MRIYFFDKGGVIATNNNGELVRKPFWNWFISACRTGTERLKCKYICSTNEPFRSSDCMAKLIRVNVGPYEKSLVIWHFEHFF
jgi:hypothetical protein